MKIQIRNPKSEIAKSDEWRVTGDDRGTCVANSCHVSHVTSHVSAFTLVEMLLVMTIIGILAAIVIPKMVGRSEQARQTAVRADISSIKTALDAFEVDNGFYPRSLQDLFQQPGNAKNWHGPYLENVPQYPWGNPYVYTYPGRHNANSYDLMSVGPDGKSGTDDDIGNWTK
jgi:general secretion pathway protein G